MPSFKLRRFGPIKNWYAFYSVNRRSKSWSTGTTDKPLAAKRAEAYFAILFAPADASPEDTRVADVLRRYQDDKREEFVSLDTAERTIEHLVRHYGGSSVADIVKVITDGVPGKAMVSFKAQLSEEQIEALAAYVRAFDKTLKPEKPVKAKK